MKLIQQAFQSHQTVMTKMEALLPTIETIAQTVLTSLKKGGTVFFMGNGGSAADAQHLAAEFIGRFQLERKAIPAIALTTDSSILTCLSNDYDYSIIFSRQLEALCKPEDIVFGISTSGNSMNVLKGIQVAKKVGAKTIGFTGHQGGELVDITDICLTIPSNNTARIQEAHIFAGHTICEWVESAFAQTTQQHARAEATTA